MLSRRDILFAPGLVPFVQYGPTKNDFNYDDRIEQEKINRLVEDFIVYTNHNNDKSEIVHPLEVCVQVADCVGLGEWYGFLKENISIIEDKVNYIKSKSIGISLKTRYGFIHKWYPEINIDPEKFYLAAIQRLKIEFGE